MSRNYSEEWERTQHYLIKSLFQDISTLSTVPEEPASFSSSPSKYEQRPYSPLPDLTIEVERQTNKHDDPEEYYIELARRMRKYYRKLYKGESTDSFDSITNEISNTYKKSKFVDDETKNKSMMDDHQVSITKSLETTIILEENIPLLASSLISATSSESAKKVKIEVEVDIHDAEFTDEFTDIIQDILTTSTRSKASDNYDSGSEEGSSSNDEDGASSTSTEEIDQKDTSTKADEKRSSSLRTPSSTFTSNENIKLEVEVEIHTQAQEANLTSDIDGTSTTKKLSHKDEDRLEKMSFLSRDDNINSSMDEVNKEDTLYINNAVHAKAASAEPSGEDKDEDSSEDSASKPDDEADSTDREEVEEKDVSDPQSEESNTELDDVIEEMRRQHCIVSRGSLQIDSNMSLNKSFVVNFSSEQILGTSTIENDIADPELFPFKRSFDRCSTPRHSICLNLSFQSDEDKDINKEADSLCKTTDSDISELKIDSLDLSTTISSIRESSDNTEDSNDDNSRNSENCKIDCEVQTSPDRLIDWENVKRNFFVGTPRMFNLCSCKNHRCEN